MKKYFEILSELEDIGFDMMSFKNQKKTADDSCKRLDVSKELKDKWEKESNDCYKEIKLCKARIENKLKQIDKLIK